MTVELPTVLFVDDEERILRSLRMQFRGKYNVLLTTSGREAIQFVRSRPVHAIVSDQRMPEMLGVDLLREVRNVSPATMRLLLTGYSNLQAIVASVNEGEIFRFVEKPWQPQYLTDVVEQAVQIAQQELASVRVAPPPARDSIVSRSAELKLLVLDEDAETFRLVRSLVGEHNGVQYATTVETALIALSEHEIAIVIADVKHRHDDVAGALKTLKRYNPSTLTIALSQLRDSRVLIDLINQGQVYRFLPKPLSRELLRRSLQSASEHYAKIKTAPSLVHRHVVETPKFEPTTLSAKLMDYWRKIRDNGRTRQSLQ